MISAVTMASSFSAKSQLPSQHTDSFVTSSDNIRIAFEVRGEGKPALVFVHGWSCDRSFWKGQSEQFSRQFRVVCIDLAGHGKSGQGRKDWTMNAFGSDVATVVNKLGLQRVILIGHSMGGDVIAEAARQLPGRVIGLIMVDTYKKLGTGRSPEEVQAFIARLRVNFTDSTRILVRSMFLPTSNAILVEQVAAYMSSAPPEIALNALENALSYSRQMPLTLEELKLPVIAINSDNAPTDTVSTKRYGVQVIIMPGTGHFLMMEDPDRFNRLLSIAIDELTGRKTPP